jgi:hypothetical protein
MQYESVDKLQKALQNDVFHYAKDSKKAAGRALGTLVEIITFYLLKTWKLNDNISIEMRLQEYGNPDITHNVEYSLHPILYEKIITIPKKLESITSNDIHKELRKIEFDIDKFNKTGNQLLSKANILRNACIIGKSVNSNLFASIEKIDEFYYFLRIYEQHVKPFALFECKRVGVEEGMKKGPQTIEKAKQGAYVARTVSSLQKIRNEKGELKGIIYKSDNTYQTDDYIILLDNIIKSNDKEFLRRFILTVGVVSNHGNWFTSKNPNKELKVLAQSYDWLIFLTDNGLAEFIETFIQKPNKKNYIVRDAFANSYSSEKKKNQFTKVQMNFEADAILLDYFKVNIINVEKWFNVISPDNFNINYLKNQLNQLRNKSWKGIL